jgi:YidC/Oxa1 family membrane protein insertase
MDQRRFLVFFVISMMIWIGWIHFLVPVLFPLPPKNPVEVIKTEDRPADAAHPANINADNFEIKGNEIKDGDVKPAVVQLPKHPIRSVWLGPTKDEKNAEKLDKFFLAAEFSSRGASVDSIELTDLKRYPAFGNRKQRLRMVGDDDFTTLRTFALNIPAINEQLKGQSLDRISWEVVEDEAKPDPDSVTFRLKSPDGIWEITKRFELKELSDDELKQPDVRDNFAEGYSLKLTITLKNLSSDDRETRYTLQGPVGVPLEDPDNTYKYRDIRMGFLRDDGSAVDDSKMSAPEVVKKEKAKAPIIWKRPIKYLGVDVTYFATLLIPGEDQIKQRTVESSKAVVVTENTDYSKYSDISVELTSTTLTVPAKGEVQHSYTLYAGPKRKQLLDQIAAGAVMDYGWFDTICRGMVWVLNTFHAMGFSYGLAIICLTIVVRSLLIPLSKHQAAHAARMKELQPKIQAKQKELEARHGRNTEEYMKASQELVAEQSKMMLGGCLPMFLQLPIFMALYRALGNSIELRMEPFLWIENLASPDALFALPFKVPFLGWTEFNLLPWISIGLMVAHQKLTMPPPQNEEQAAQYKMMNFMMIFMGATFYRVPAGLCLYFIATNIWSMTERTIFERKAKAAALNGPPDSGTVPPSKGPETKPAEPATPSKLAEWWTRLQEAADKDGTFRNEPRNDSLDGNGKSSGGNGKKRGKR